MEPEDDGIVIVKYQITNGTLEPLTGLHFGILADFDLSAADSVEILEGIKLAIHRPQGAGPVTGLVALTYGWFSVLDNGASKSGLTRQQQFGLLSTYTDLPDQSAAGDKMIMLHSGPFSLAPLGSTEVAFAFIGANSREELIARATRARMRFDITTDVNDDHTLPTGFALRQNYPNPFNPSTTIAFTLKSSTQVSLDVYNLLGQPVTRLVDARLSAGGHQVVWNGTDRSGSPVASGVYFYRLTTVDGSETRKMMLLK
jgi:hypothetical protein